jgi:hypothetical protein
MSRRRADVFFYGLFMDQELLRSKGLRPENAELASVHGLALRIGQRAALVPTPGSRVYGLVMSLTVAELEKLYSEPSVQAYKPEPVLAQVASGGTIAALCYNLPQPPAATESNPEYAARLRTLAEKVGLPAEYLGSIR